MDPISVIRIVSVGLLLTIEGMRDLRKKEIGLILPIINAIIAVFLLPAGKDVGIISMGIAFALGLIIIIISFLTNESIGLGDGIIICSTGLMLGWKKNMIMFFLACFICAVLSAVLLTLKKVDKKSKIPFVPFMVPAFLLTVVFTGI